MNELLNRLEEKIKHLLDERSLYLGERDLLSLKVIELQDQIELLKKQLEQAQIKCTEIGQEASLTSMVVEEMLNLIEEKSAPGA